MSSDINDKINEALNIYKDDRSLNIAQRCLLDLAEKYPDNEDILFWLAALLRESKEEVYIFLSIKIFEKVISLNPKNKYGWAWLANTHLMLEKFKEARNCANKALKIDDGYWLPICIIAQSFKLKSKNKKGNKYYRKVIKLFGSVNNVLDYADEVASRSVCEHALFLYNAVLAVDDMNPRANYGRAKLLYRNFANMQVAEHFEKALKGYPDNIDILNALGNCYYSSFDVDYSLNMYDKVLKLDENNIEALVGKSYSLGDIDETEEALSCVDKVLDIDSNNVDAIISKANILSNSNSYKKTIDFCDGYLDNLSFEDKLKLLVFMAECSFDEDYGDEALKYYDKILELDPANLKAINGKLKVLSYDENLDDFDNFVDLVNNDVISELLDKLDKYDVCLNIIKNGKLNLYGV